MVCRVMVISLPAETRKILSSELEINHFVKRLPSSCCDNIADNIFLTVNISTLRQRYKNYLIYFA